MDIVQIHIRQGDLQLRQPGRSRFAPAGIGRGVCCRKDLQQHRTGGIAVPAGKGIALPHRRGRRKGSAGQSLNTAHIGTAHGIQGHRDQLAGVGAAGIFHRRADHHAASRLTGLGAAAAQRRAGHLHIIGAVHRRLQRCLGGAADRIRTGRIGRIHTIPLIAVRRALYRSCKGISCLCHLHAQQLIRCPHGIVPNLHTVGKPLNIAGCTVIKADMPQRAIARTGRLQRRRIGRQCGLGHGGQQRLEGALIQIVQGIHKIALGQQLLHPHPRAAIRLSAGAHIVVQGGVPQLLIIVIPCRAGLHLADQPGIIPIHIEEAAGLEDVILRRKAIQQELLGQ